MLAVRRIGRHQVGHVAHHEHLTGAGVKHDLGCSARVTAGDDHDGRLLPARRQRVIPLPFARKGV
jgi:hypothetical protein